MCFTPVSCRHPDGGPGLHFVPVSARFPERAAAAEEGVLVRVEMLAGDHAFSQFGIPRKTGEIIGRARGQLAFTYGLSRLGDDVEPEVRSQPVHDAVTVDEGRRLPVRVRLAPGPFAACRLPVHEGCPPGFTRDAVDLPDQGCLQRSASRQCKRDAEGLADADDLLVRIEGRYRAGAHAASEACHGIRIPVPAEGDVRILLQLPRPDILEEFRR